MRFGLEENDILKLQKIFADYSQIESVKIYGSRAKGNYKNEITDRLKKFRGHHDKKAQIFMKSIVEILQGLKYQPQRVASQIHLMEVLHDKDKLNVDKFAATISQARTSIKKLFGLDENNE